jgi:arylamine N-acetyltransferase
VLPRQVLLHDVWTDQYWFTLAPTTPAVLQACAEHSFRHHPLFTRKVVVTLPLPDGRVSLNDWTLKTRRAGQPTEERLLASEAERDAVLADVFGIDLGAYP